MNPAKNERTAKDNFSEKKGEIFSKIMQKEGNNAKNVESVRRLLSFETGHRMVLGNNANEERMDS